VKYWQYCKFGLSRKNVDSGKLKRKSAVQESGILVIASKSVTVQQFTRERVLV